MRQVVCAPYLTGKTRATMVCSFNIQTPEERDFGEVMITMSLHDASVTPCPLYIYVIVLRIGRFMIIRCADDLAMHITYRAWH